ncbi:hypothetical protein ACH5RR_036458 [Cinchona calisaya]|uniref:Uncharacterized protein n=1 Tax=Cinchona calisaya TaxID=153742 RepID=A0ABD2Y7W7_9GENT
MVKTSLRSILISVLSVIAIAISFPNMEATRVGRKLLEGGAAVIIVPCETDYDCLSSEEFLFDIVKDHCINQGTAVGLCELL